MLGTGKHFLGIYSWWAAERCSTTPEDVLNKLWGPLETERLFFLHLNTHIQPIGKKLKSWCQFSVCWFWKCIKLVWHTRVRLSIRKQQLSDLVTFHTTCYLNHFTALNEERGTASHLALDLQTTLLLQSSCHYRGTGAENMCTMPTHTHTHTHRDTHKEKSPGTATRPSCQCRSQSCNRAKGIMPRMWDRGKGQREGRRRRRRRRRRWRRRRRRRKCW